MAKVEQKQAVVSEIKEKMEKAASVVMVDARGLTVEQDTVLRRKLRDAGVDYKVYKNTMVGFAIQGTEFEGLSEFLAGPSAFAFSYEDATTAASVLNAQLKDMKALEFKAGIIDGTIYDAAGMKIIAEIPSREILLSKLLGSFKSPMSAFARVIKQIAEKDGDVVAVAPVEEAVNAEEAPQAEAAPEAPVEAVVEAPVADEAAPEATAE